MLMNFVNELTQYWPVTQRHKIAQEYINRVTSLALVPLRLRNFVDKQLQMTDSQMMNLQITVMLQLRCYYFTT